MSAYIQALTAKREATYNEAEKLLNEAQKRGDAFSESEEKRWTDLEAELNRIDNTIAAAKRGIALETPGKDDKPELRFDEPMKNTELRTFTRRQAGIDTELYADERLVRNLGAYFKAQYFRDNSMMPAEYRAFSTAQGATGGYLVPMAIAGDLVQYAFNRMAAMSAGVRVLGMSANSIVVPKVAGVPTGQWLGEGAQINEESITLSKTTLEARRLSTLVKASIEVMQDSAFNVGEIVVQNVSKAFALALDQGILAGPGGTNQLTGVRNWANVPTTSVGAPLTNTAGSGYDLLVTAINSVRLNNYAYDDAAQILFQQDVATLGTLKASGTGNYLNPPAYLDDVRRLATTNLATESGKTYILSGDWDMLWLGILLNQMSFTLDQRYAELGQVGWVFHLRSDSVVTDVKAFDIRTTIG